MKMIMLSCCALVLVFCGLASSGAQEQEDRVASPETRANVLQTLAQQTNESLAGIEDSDTKTEGQADSVPIRLVQAQDSGRTGLSAEDETDGKPQEAAKEKQKRGKRHSAGTRALKSVGKGVGIAVGVASLVVLYVAVLAATS